MPDAHGNIIELYNGNDKYPNDWYSYNAFGENEYFEDTCIPNKWGYCGQLRDWETGNYYMRARYYNPGTGRFISEDPIKDGSNWYSYCGSNPVMFVDPSGKIRQGYTDEKGVYHADPDAEEFGNDSDTYKILEDLGNRWASTNDSETRRYLAKTADEVRYCARQGTEYWYAQDAIMDILHENKALAQEYNDKYFEYMYLNPYAATPYSWYVSMTCSDWNYKEMPKWQVPYSNFKGSDMNEYNRKNYVPWMYFDGMLISADKFGNINLGYIGTIMGFKDIAIKNVFTMDKDDGPYVEHGIFMAEQGR